MNKKYTYFFCLLYMTIPYDYLINDIRDEKHFSDTTFSGYLKNDVYKALFNAITEFKIEESCNLVC